MCFLVILGLLMGWLSPSESDAGEGSSMAERRLGKIASHPIPADAGSNPAPMPIPEMYLLPQRIPVKGDGLPAVAEAERVVRSRR